MSFHPKNLIFIKICTKIWLYCEIYKKYKKYSFHILFWFWSYLVICMKLYTFEYHVSKRTAFELQQKTLLWVWEVISAVMKHPVYSVIRCITALLFVYLYSYDFYHHSNKISMTCFVIVIVLAALFLPSTTPYRFFILTNRSP